MQPLQLRLGRPSAAGGTGLSPCKPPAQAAAASAAVGADARQTRSGSEQRQRVQAVGAKTASPNIENKAGIVSRQPARPVARPASLPEREQRLVLLRPGPFPTPDAGKASQHAQVLRAGTSDGCRNRILCLTVPLSTHARTTEPTACTPASLKSQSRAG